MSDESMSDEPDQPTFKRGDRVRMKAAARVGRQTKFFTGTVIGINPVGDTGIFSISVRRDGASPSTSGGFWVWPNEEPTWELIPPHDLSEDQVAVSLAKAVLAGDVNAARPLADRVMEICGATPIPKEEP